MEAGVFDEYYRCIEVIESQKQLMNFTANDWPNLKKTKRSELMKTIKKMAYPGFLKRKEALKFTAEALKEIINGNR